MHKPLITTSYDVSLEVISPIDCPLTITVCKCVELSCGKLLISLSSAGEKPHNWDCTVSQKAFQMARIVSHGAKIRDWTKLENANCANWVARPVPDLVVTNPPWGIRLTDDK